LLLIGCGALGSKVGLHLARAGLTNLTLVDNDELSPHNLVRHGLLAEQLGQNKAAALQQAIEAIFQERQQAISTKAISENAFEVIRGGQQSLLSEHSQIIDCSASVSLLNVLADSNLSVPVMRAELADEGNLGILLREGRDRNPRVDDLQMCLYDLAIDDDRIAAWLQRQKGESTGIGSGLEEITIGLGCSSATVRMADDVISYHAALAAMSIKKRWVGNEERSGIQVSYLGDNSVDFGGVDFHEVARVRELIPSNTPNWTVRLSHKAYSYIQVETVAALPNETGGLLVGFIHYKRKIIYVTRALPPPQDSEGYPYAFKLGIQDVPEQLEVIYQRTGGVISYVGEWHSHPNGSEQLSTTDLAAVKQISAHLQRARIPTHIIIATAERCYSHLFAHQI
jgi:proteasome lid subunit RPN8/RPN11